MGFLRDNAPFLSAGLLLTFGSAFGQTFFISLFAGEIRAEFGLSHGAWGTIYALGTFTSALVMIWAGALTDTIRIRALGVITLAITAGACLQMAATPAAWLLPLTILALRFGGQGMMSHLAGVAMARWFVATRGRALSIAGLGFHVAEATLPLVIVALLAVMDWRLIWVGCAVISLAMMPVLLRLLRLERTPQAVAESTASLGMDNRHWTRRAVLTSPLFWLMVPALLGPSAFNTAFFFQQVHFTEVKGWDRLEFVALIPLYTGVGIAAMIGSGALLDRVGTARLLPLYQLPMAAAFVVFAQAEGLAVAALGFALLGLTSGANATLPAAFWAEFYGTRHLGAIRAMAAAVMVLGSAIGPLLTGVLIDAGTGIETQYLWVGGYFVLTCLSVWLGIRAAAPRLSPAPAQVDV